MRNTAIDNERSIIEQKKLFQERDWGKNVRCSSGGMCREYCKSECNTGEIIAGPHTRDRGGDLTPTLCKDASVMSLTKDIIEGRTPINFGDPEAVRNLIEGLDRDTLGTITHKDPLK
jgi:hypothetical protein